MKVGTLLIVMLTVFYIQSAHAEIDGMSITLDNDLFIGNDSGYTNGLYISFYDIGADKNMPSNDFFVAPLMWSMPEYGVDGAVNAYMIGQTMNTPNDITIADPAENEFPYSALLALTNTYITTTRTISDRVSTTIGMVGPAALGEEAQKAVHKSIGSDEPKGWDTQLQNEVVFSFSRARTWRTFVSASSNADILSNVDFSIGTLRSAFSSGVTFRYGRGLQGSYATTLLASSRTTNPLAVNHGWYFYTGLQAGYIFNQIFTDGNTFYKSRSIDYDHEFIGFSAGFAYASENYSITFAINDSNLIQSADTRKSLKDLTQFGTLTFGWRM